VPQGCLTRVEGEHDLLAPLSTAGARSTFTATPAKRQRPGSDL